MADAGIDIEGIVDIAPSLAVASGRKGLAQAIARRLMTPFGSLFYDVTYGYDLRGLVNSADSDAKRIGARIESECLKDERVQKASASVSFINGTLTVDLVLTDGIGPFPLTLTVDQVTVAVLKQAA